MKPVNPVSEKDMSAGLNLASALIREDIRDRSLLKWLFDPNVRRICEHVNSLDADVIEEIRAEWGVRFAQALADARAEGYVAGVEDAAKLVCRYTDIADEALEALLGPKKEGGG